MGFDTPETFCAKCDDELARAEAEARLEQLIGSGQARIIESGERDRHGRTLSELTIDGRGVAGIMIAEGLARVTSLWRPGMPAGSARQVFGKAFRQRIMRAQRGIGNAFGRPADPDSD
jgi:endonuclease YncB( thermonuclease family)